MALNRPERWRSARTTWAILAPTWAWAGSADRKSGMAMGTGLMLPWVTSTWSAAEAGKGASAAMARMQASRKFLMPFSKNISAILVPDPGFFLVSLIHHLAGVEAQRIDFAPLAVAVGGQFIRLALEDSGFAGRSGGAVIGVGIGIR